MSIMMLTQLPRALKESHQVRATYDRIYRMVINGDLPAEKDLGGRWIVKSDDLPVYAEKLGFKGKSNG